MIHYPDSASEVAFLIGGIGTGNFSLGARGNLQDFEWYNHPGKGNRNPYTFFALWLKEHDGKTDTRVLEAPFPKPYSRSHGLPVELCAGLPRFAESRFSARYPFANVKFLDETLPLSVEMESFNPFVPLDEDASSIPAGVIRYRVKNTASEPVEVAIAGSTSNLAGVREFERTGWESIRLDDNGINVYREETGLRGLYFHCEKLDANHLHFGNIALATPEVSVSCKREWLRRGNWDGLRDFWDDFSSDGTLERESVYSAVNPGDYRTLKTGSIAVKKRIQPGQSEIFTFLLSWYFPNRMDNWEYDACTCGKCETHSVKNYYATRFSDAWDAAVYLNKHLSGLEARSREFTRALYDSTLPESVIESAANNITTLRSPVCFRLADGTFLGWEGGFATEGCCEGSCTHVWNYAQTVAFLFPELEKTMRRVEFLIETNEDGRMAFRTRRVFGKPQWEYHPAADGQMGCIVRLYRDWKLTGDDAFLRELWPHAKRALAYARRYWDENGDFVLDAQQHNTYDIEFYGENSLTNTVFFAALAASAEIAETLGEADEAVFYREILKKGAAKMDALLFSGEYYEQKTEDANRYLYQYGKGCLSDQLFGQMLSHLIGLGYLLPEEHVKSALLAVYRYNFIQDFSRFTALQRTYALSDESGLVLCTWPNGDRPKLPFIYSDEVWAGVEYQVAAHLVYEGFVREAMDLVEAVRARYDGFSRNPYCEVECGNHYVRSMASWALIPALSGFRFDMRQNRISFSPYINENDFHCFFSTGKAWGVLHQIREGNGAFSQRLEIIEGDKLYLNDSK
mgnify:FL=1